MSTIRKVIYRITALAALLFLVSCSEPVQEPLRVASSPWPGYEPLYLARELGYLDETKISLFELPSSDITMESFRNHSADLATLTLDETLELLHDGAKLRVLLILDVSNGGDAVMVHPDIKKLSDIKGKRVSIVNIPLGLYMLNRVLDKADLSRQDVEVFPMADTHQENFYRQGKADVVITYEPTKTRLANQGMNVIFDSSDIPNEIFDLLVVHEDTYMQRKAEICSITQQWFKTLDYMQQHPQDAAIHISNRLGVEPFEFTAMLDGIVFPTRKINTQMLSGNIPGILEPAGRLNQIMQLEGQLSRDINLAYALDPDFANCFTQ